MSSTIGNRPTFRKLESLVIACMFIVVPLFAVRIVNRATNKLQAMRVSVDLEHNLRKAREMARKYRLVVTLSTKPGIGKEPGIYLIQQNKKIVDTVKLPDGVSVIGSVCFDERGIPERRSVFLINKEMATVSVDVDARGIVSVP